MLKSRNLPKLLWLLWLLPFLIGFLSYVFIPPEKQLLKADRAFKAQEFLQQLRVKAEQDFQKNYDGPPILGLVRADNGTLVQGHLLFGVDIRAARREPRR